ncbi:MAG: hypothetical protein Q8Q44_03675 [Nocardioides sp.]|nr:hypothetical protein [Nocardioides sp.]
MTTVPLVALVLGVVLAVLLVPRGDDGDASVQAEVERLEQEFAERDRIQIEAITDSARTVAQELGTVLIEARATLPEDLPGGEGGQVADPATVKDWSDRLEELVAAFGDPQSAGTSVNVARGALTTAVDAVRIGVAAYGDALALKGADREAALARAAESFDLGRRVWNVAAIQVDDANVQAGLGHQHVVLAGETPPDTLPEGTDAD